MMVKCCRFVDRTSRLSPSFLRVCLKAAILFSSPAPPQLLRSPSLDCVFYPSFPLFGLLVQGSFPLAPVTFVSWCVPFPPRSSLPTQVFSHRTQGRLAHFPASLYLAYPTAITLSVRYTGRKSVNRQSRAPSTPAFTRKYITTHLPQPN